jgi:hypothetical protein
VHCLRELWYRVESLPLGIEQELELLGIEIV